MPEHKKVHICHTKNIDQVQGQLFIVEVTTYSFIFQLVQGNQEVFFETRKTLLEYCEKFKVTLFDKVFRDNYVVSM